MRIVCRQTIRMTCQALFSLKKKYNMFHSVICSSCDYSFKGFIFLKNRHFSIKERFNKLIYGINTIIICGTCQPVKF